MTTPAPKPAQDAAPIPVSRWDARKSFVYLVEIFLFVALGLAIHTGNGVPWVIGGIVCVALGFVLAPSAEQAIKGLSYARALAAGVTFSSAEVPPPVMVGDGKD